MNHDKVLIIDFGSQVTQLIARRIREVGVYSEIKNPDDVNIEDLKNDAPKAIIFSGGPNSVYEDDAPTISKAIFNLNIPILGICYGQQLICHLLGGKVSASTEREFGKSQIEISKESKLVDGLSSNVVWMSHGDKAEKIPEGFEVIAKTNSAPYAAIANEKERIYGLQFHPEVEHSVDGRKIIRNFIIDIAGCKSDWSMANFKDEQIQEIKTKVGDKQVICGLSGGVDSSVVAALISKAIGKQLTCIFVDHGLLRKDEGKEVKETIAKSFDINFVYVDARDLFLGKLKGVTDPEKKRKIIEIIPR